MGPEFKCRNCAHSKTSTRKQQFDNGSVHDRVECERCGSFVKWEKQISSAQSFRTKLFNVVRAIAGCSTNDQFQLIQAEARQLMGEAGHKVCYLEPDPNQLSLALPNTSGTISIKGELKRV